MTLGILPVALPGTQLHLLYKWVMTISTRLLVQRALMSSEAVWGRTAASTLPIPIQVTADCYLTHIFLFAIGRVIKPESLEPKTVTRNSVYHWLGKKVMVIGWENELQIISQNSELL